VTVRATEDIPFERVRLAKTTQEQKTQMDVASALAAGDKAAVGTRYAANFSGVPLIWALGDAMAGLSHKTTPPLSAAHPLGALRRHQRACS